MRMDFPTANPRWRLRDALRAMERADIDLLPVVEGERFVGVVTTAEILKARRHPADDRRRGDLREGDPEVPLRAPDKNRGASQGAG